MKFNVAGYTWDTASDTETKKRHLLILHKSDVVLDWDGNGIWIRIDDPYAVIISNACTCMKMMVRRFDYEVLIKHHIKILGIPQEGHKEDKDE